MYEKRYYQFWLGKMFVGRDVIVKIALVPLKQPFKRNLFQTHDVVQSMTSVYNYKAALVEDIPYYV
jgi:hypothetical protein